MLALVRQHHRNVSLNVGTLRRKTRGLSKGYLSLVITCSTPIQRVAQRDARIGIQGIARKLRSAPTPAPVMRFPRNPSTVWPPWPFHFLASALRATETATDAPPALMEFLVRMGHAPFHYPTPDGYPEAAAPWMGTLLWRWNFGVALTEGKIGNVKFAAEAVRKFFRSDEEMFAHFLGRKPTAEEIASVRAAGAPTPVLLASPGFQKC